MWCQVCYEKLRRRVHLPCACQVCRECLATWVRERCKLFGSADFLISCPNPTHKTVLSPTLLQSLLPKRDFRQFEAATFKHLLLHPAYRQCPHCQLISWLDSRFCFSSAKCTRCGFIWSSRISNVLLFFSTTQHNFLATVVKEFTTSPCPSCDVPIEKRGGCLHMTCLKCKHQYCHVCKRPYFGHDPANCLRYIQVVMIWGLIIALILLLKVLTLFPQQLATVTFRYIVVAISLAIDGLAGLLLCIFIWEFMRGRIVRYHCWFLVPFISIVSLCSLVTCLWSSAEACNILLVLTCTLLATAQSFLYISLSFLR
jgi:hypothetical protein